MGAKKPVKDKRIEVCTKCKGTGLIQSKLPDSVYGVKPCNFCSGKGSYELPTAKATA